MYVTSASFNFIDPMLIMPLVGKVTVVVRTVQGARTVIGTTWNR